MRIVVVNNQVRDLQHSLNADGRDFVIEVGAPGKNPAPVPADPFDVDILADVPKGFDDEASLNHATTATITSTKWCHLANLSVSRCNEASQS